MTPRPGQIVLAVAGLAIGGLAVFALKEATLSTHHPVKAESRSELILEAHEHGGQRTQTLDELVEAIVLHCRLEVDSDLAIPIERTGIRFRAVLAPSLDQTNRRQFRGCLEDWTIDHLRVDVIKLEDQQPSSAAVP